MAFPVAAAAGQTHTEGNVPYISVADGGNFVWIVDASAGTDDQTAAEVTVTPTGNLAATDVQSALNELQGDIDTLGTVIGNYVGSATTVTALNALTDPIGGGTPNNGDWAVLSQDDGANVRGIYVADGAGGFTLALPISFAAASATDAGIVELATDAEAITGTDATRAVTPANLPTAVEAHETTTSITGVVGKLFNYNDEDGTSTGVDLRIRESAALPANDFNERIYSLVGHAALPDGLYRYDTTASQWVAL